MIQTHPQDHDVESEVLASLRGDTSYVDRNNVQSAVDGIKLRIVRTEENAIRLHLKEYRDSIIDWISLCGMALTLLVTLVAGTFTDFLGISRYFWSALISVALIVTVARLVYAIFYKYIKLKGKDEVEIFIERLKRG